MTGDRFFDTRGDMDVTDRMSAQMMLHAYVDRYQQIAPRFDEQRHGWHEYGNYTGALFALLFGASLISTTSRRP